ncbi:hypothetical protein [Bacillus alveayuensis]|jgi:hypothetical protein|uniref:Uncharacterized protein n=1 Tax=Aeribacillus alveayuensis TaxID=279215 RepID=A0ABT9VNM1_9BACI|nr:hypothetical protein [Bacillus alveayuensis]MDQ0162583.1 hypothetical protein [Bacillus alveayuensis]
MEIFHFKTLQVYHKEHLGHETVEQLVMCIPHSSHEVGKFHYFRVPVHAIIDAYYHAIYHAEIVRIRFEFPEKRMHVQQFFLQDTESRYINALFPNDQHYPAAITDILHSIRFFGPKHFSFIIDSRNKKREKDIEI